MARTNSTAVILVLGNDYGVDQTGSNPDLSPYIEAASSIVDQVVSLALSERGLALSTTVQELIERWLAAYLYTGTDPVYSSKGQGGASASFLRDQGENANPYKSRAIALDYSGMLNALLNRKFAGMSWLGKVPSEQIPNWDRD